MLFEVNTLNNEDINEAIIKLNELKEELKKIHVGDTVKITNTGKMYTSNTSFFIDEIMKNKYNDAVLEQLARLASRYDFEKSWYLKDGISSIDDIMFKVEYIGEDKKAIISIAGDGRFSKTYLININGLERW